MLKHRFVTALVTDLVHFAQEDPVLDMIRKMSFYNDHSGDMAEVYHGDIVRCYAYVAPSEQFGVRANTVASYCDVNRKVRAAAERSHLYQSDNLHTLINDILGVKKYHLENLIFDVCSLKTL